MPFSDFLGKELNGYMPIPETLTAGLESRVMSHRRNWHRYRHADSRGELGGEERQSSKQRILGISPILAFYKFSLVIPHLYCFWCCRDEMLAVPWQTGPLRHPHIFTCCPLQPPPLVETFLLVTSWERHLHHTLPLPSLGSFKTFLS